MAREWQAEYIQQNWETMGETRQGWGGGGCNILWHRYATKLGEISLFWSIIHLRGVPDWIWGKNYTCPFQSACDAWQEFMVRTIQYFCFWVLQRRYIYWWLLEHHLISMVFNHPEHGPHKGGVILETGIALDCCKKKLLIKCWQSSHARMLIGPPKLRFEAGGQSPITSGQIWALGEVPVPAFQTKIERLVHHLQGHEKLGEVIVPSWMGGLRNR